MHQSNHQITFPTLHRLLLPSCVGAPISRVARWSDRQRFHQLRFSSAAGGGGGPIIERTAAADAGFVDDDGFEEGSLGSCFEAVFCVAPFSGVEWVWCCGEDRWLLVGAASMGASLGDDGGIVFGLLLMILLNNVVDFSACDPTESVRRSISSSCPFER